MYYEGKELKDLFSEGSLPYFYGSKLPALTHTMDCVVNEGLLTA